MKNLVITFFLVFNFTFIFSQDFNHEIGISIGATSMQSDYKERTNDIVASYRNVGYITGISYYLSFDSNMRRWNDKTEFLKNHFRLKLDANYIQNKFSHRGDVVSKSNEVDRVKYLAMTGSTTIYNFGAHIEYLILDSYTKRKFEPYLVGGFYYNIYQPKIESELGDITKNSNLLPLEYDKGIHLEESSIPSFSFGAGARYNINNMTLFFEIKSQKFLNDKVDGLQPLTGENKNRDWLSYAQFGMIFKVN